MISYNHSNEPVYIELPTSKSLSNRALIIQHLCNQHFNILHLSESDDTLNLLENLSSGMSSIHVGAAGTNMRFLISALSISEGKWYLEGSSRLNERPVGELVNCLQQLGANIQYAQAEGYPPLVIQGKKLDGGEVNIAGNISSQFVSSLLLIAPVLSKGLRIHISTDLVSQPYVEMTLQLMHFFGVQHRREGNTIVVEPQAYKARDYQVEPDWSSAAFWYGFSAITGRTVFIKGLSLTSLQGDRKMAEYGQLLGLITRQGPDGLEISASSKSNYQVSMNLVNEPDLFPCLAFSAAALRIKSRFDGLQTLNLKESERIIAIEQELRKLNIHCVSGSDFFEITEFGELPENVVFHTYHDHRIAMASSLMGLVIPNVSIEDPMVVSKSYPGFWKDLKYAGYIIEHSSLGR